MLKKTIVYVDYNDVESSEDFYFNLTKTELTEMEFSEANGMKELLQEIVRTKDAKELLRIFKRIIVSSVGVKSDDGKRFVKNDKIAEDFVSSPAFDSLFMELATNTDSAVAFVKGILPKDLSLQLNEKEITESTIKMANTPLGD